MWYVIKCREGYYKAARIGYSEFVNDPEKAHWHESITEARQRAIRRKLHDFTIEPLGERVEPESYPENGTDTKILTQLERLTEAVDRLTDRLPGERIGSDLS